MYKLPELHVMRTLRPSIKLQCLSVLLKVSISYSYRVPLRQFHIIG